jgi:carbamoyl-phosphate synthase small subunit
MSEFHKKSLDLISLRSYLICDNGDIFEGKTKFSQNSLYIKNPIISTGEVCFNTSITGYQEIITDPSYTGQIINFTFPHIGNVGANIEDCESRLSLLRNEVLKLSIEGTEVNKFTKSIVISKEITNEANYRSDEDFVRFLTKNNILHIFGLDTRSIANKIRSGEIDNGMIVTIPQDFDQNIDNFLIKCFDYLKTLQTMDGMEIASQISGTTGYWKQWKEQNIINNSKYNNSKKLAIIDFGIKEKMVYLLNDQGFDCDVFHWNVDFDEIKDFDGYFLSNGAGDPRATMEKNGGIVKNLISKIIKSNKPLFGICLGHQMISLSLGCKVERMDVGHRGVNHPVQNLQKGDMYKRVEITAQNHGFCVTEIPQNIDILCKSLFDNSIEGIEVKNKKILSVQYHPESSSGPHDSRYLFQKFSNFFD